MRRRQRELRTNRYEVSAGDGSLDVEPVLDLVQLVVLAVKRRRHLADVTTVVSATLQISRLRVATYTGGVLDGVLKLAQAVGLVIRRRDARLGEPIVRRQRLEQGDNRLVERDSL